MSALDRYVAGLQSELEAALEPPEPPETEPRLVLREVSYDELPGWSNDDVQEALPAMARTCRRFAVFPDERKLEPVAVGGTVADWRDACSAILESRARGGEVARALFETHFRPFLAFDRTSPLGLFTGYYEALLHGSLRRSPKYQYPLYGPPRDVISVDLGEFREDLDGRRIAGRLAGRRLVPYPDRSAIDAGALGGRGLEFVWVDDPVDAFFLHVQGSGRVRMEDGSTMRVGYAGQNGHAYFAIGRELIERGEVAREDMSMQAIRSWIATNPEQSRSLLEKNPSYVFFRNLGMSRNEPVASAVGAMGVELTPERSLAVDRRFIALGTPIWLETTLPVAPPHEPEGPRSWQRLLVAQDTGGAIRGPVRGDVFFGFGERASALAGKMKQNGRYWLLLPVPLAERLADRELPE